MVATFEALLSGQNGLEGDQFGIDKDGIPIFADGFDAGDLAAWSAVVP